LRARAFDHIRAREMDQGDDDGEKRREEACRLEEAIRDLPSRNLDGLKCWGVLDLAWELGLSRSVCRMIRLFRAGGAGTRSLIELG
jgi:hypothetical protein